ncbi:hypothetical protein EVAR_56253_1 [Eumeta japonica]|uniref:Uncharacterized protein n=1 Tax=Eumeta variegata TaxID=151549 RepID=A0A4C1XKJ4_EUMVA|nr:hypothetical protein EVAR_56253_1 [Eumeta japonica]
MFIKKDARSPRTIHALKCAFYRAARVRTGDDRRPCVAMLTPTCGFASMDRGLGDANDLRHKCDDDIQNQQLILPSIQMEWFDLA